MPTRRLTPGRAQYKEDPPPLSQPAALPHSGDHCDRRASVESAHDRRPMFLYGCLERPGCPTATHPRPTRHVEFPAHCDPRLPRRPAGHRDLAAHLPGLAQLLRRLAEDHPATWASRAIDTSPRSFDIGDPAGGARCSCQPQSRRGDSDVIADGSHRFERRGTRGGHAALPPEPPRPERTATSPTRRTGDRHRVDCEATRERSGPLPFGIWQLVSPGHASVMSGVGSAASGASLKTSSPLRRGAQIGMPRPRRGTACPTAAAGVRWKRQIDQAATASDQEPNPHRHGRRPRSRTRPARAALNRSVQSCEQRKPVSRRRVSASGPLA